YIGSENKAREEPQIDQVLLQHMLSIIKFYYADVAGDEQVAGQRLMSGAQMEMDDDACQCKWMWFDGLRLVGRDKTHAARRILTRPWKADAFLEECYNRMVLDHDSISSTIMNSAAISDWFADKVAKSEVSLAQTFVI
uniref:hypothetical protein n=1 Tax=Limnohabitans sp. TaxID=1907725 RepID=UPI00333FAE32